MNKKPKTTTTPPSPPPPPPPAGRRPPFAEPNADYPSTGGDILKGASPAEQARARAAAIAWPPAPTKP